MGGFGTGHLQLPGRVRAPKRGSCDPRLMRRKPRPAPWYWVRVATYEISMIAELTRHDPDAILRTAVPAAGRQTTTQGWANTASTGGRRHFARPLPDAGPRDRHGDDVLPRRIARVRGQSPCARCRVNTGSQPNSPRVRNPIRTRQRMIWARRLVSDGSAGLGLRAATV